jgi:hypothetical protein
VLVVLRECVEEPDGYAYKDEIQYRELALEEGRFICRVWRRAGGTASGTYTVDSEYHPKPKERTTGMKSRSPLSVLRTTIPPSMIHRWLRWWR